MTVFQIMRISQLTSPTSDDPTMPANTTASSSSAAPSTVSPTTTQPSSSQTTQPSTPSSAPQTVQPQSTDVPAQTTTSSTGKTIASSSSSKTAATATSSSAAQQASSATVTSSAAATGDQTTSSSRSTSIINTETTGAVPQMSLRTPIIIFIVLAMLIALYFRKRGGGVALTGDKKPVDKLTAAKEKEKKAREKSDAMDERFKKIDALKKSAEEAREKAKKAAEEARKAAEAAGGENVFDGSIDGEPNIRKRVWRRPGEGGKAGKRADKEKKDAEKAEKDAKEKEDAYDKEGGKDAWQAAYDASDSAATELFNAQMEVKKEEAAKAGEGVTERPMTAVIVCREGDRRPQSSEEKSFDLADMDSVRFMHESFRSEEEEVMGFVDFLEDFKEGFFALKKIRSYLTGDHWEIQTKGGQYDVPVAGPLDHIGFPDFLTYHEKIAEQLVASMRRFELMVKRIRESGEYWVRYDIQTYVLKCERMQICKNNAWMTVCTFSLTEGGRRSVDTERETVTSGTAGQEALTKMITKLGNKNAPVLQQMKEFESACR